MEEILKDIQSGAFADEFLADYNDGFKKLYARREKRLIMNLKSGRRTSRLDELD